MNRIPALVAALCAVVAFSSFGQNADTSPEPSTTDTNSTIRALADLGPGVHKVKTSPNNTFQSCVVVGQARISTVLGASKGIMTARRNAKLSAESEFVSWLKTNTSSVRTSGDATEFTLKGDGTQTSETASSEETSTETITSAAQGAIRGLTLIGSFQDAETKVLTLVFAWKPSVADATRQVGDAMSDKTAPAESPSAPAPSPAEGEKSVQPGLSTKVAVTPEAAEFL